MRQANRLGLQLHWLPVNGHEIGLSTLHADHRRMAAIPPCLVKRFLRAAEELHHPTVSLQAVNRLPIELSPRLQHRYLTIQRRKLRHQLLLPTLHSLEITQGSLYRGISLQMARCRIGRERRHLLENRLIGGILLQEGLQFLVALSLLLQLDMHDTQRSQLRQEALIFLMIDKEGQFLHFSDHTATSSSSFALRFS